MRQKRILSLLLAMLFMSLPAFAGAISISDYLGDVETKPAELALKEESLLLVRDFGGYSVKYSAIIENKSDFSANLSNASLEILDKDQNIIASESIYSATPYSIVPGGEATIRNSYSMLSEEQKALVSSFRLNFEGRASMEEIQYTTLSASVEYEEVQITDYDAIDLSKLTDELPTRPQGQFVVTVENDKEQPVYDADVVVVVRDQDGKLVWADSTSLYNIGIPQGGKVLMKGEVSSQMLAALAENKGTVKTVTAQAFFMKEVPLEDME